MDLTSSFGKVIRVVFWVGFEIKVQPPYIIALQNMYPGSISGFYSITQKGLRETVFLIG